MKTKTPQISDYAYHMDIQTRWNDNDIYGHVNNAVYYMYFDTLVNNFLIETGLLDLNESPIIGLVVETQCQYLAPISYPTNIKAALRIRKIGNSSVRYEIGLFNADTQEIFAQGHFVHVYVDTETRRPTSLPQTMRDILQTLTV